ncbi:MAG: hypothetical protein ACYDDZ_10945 [Acidimicrobiales bacterium]
MSNIDPFAGFEETDPGTPETTEVSPPTPALVQGPKAATFNPFDSPSAPAKTDPAAKLPAVPVIAAGRVVREPATGRIGIVIQSGALPTEPHRDGEKHAVVVAWFDHVSHPIVTDQVQVIT